MRPHRSSTPFALLLAAALPVAAQATLEVCNESGRAWYVVADMPCQWLVLRQGRPDALGPEAQVAILPNSHWRLDPGEVLELATLKRADGTAPDLRLFLQDAPPERSGGPDPDRAPLLVVGGLSNAFRWPDPAAQERAAQVGTASAGGGRNAFVLTRQDGSPAGAEGGAGLERKSSQAATAAGPQIESKRQVAGTRTAGADRAKPRALAGGPRIATGFRIATLDPAPPVPKARPMAHPEPPPGSLVIANDTTEARRLAFPGLARELLVEVRPLGPGLAHQRLLSERDEAFPLPAHTEAVIQALLETGAFAFDLTVSGPAGGGVARYRWERQEGDVDSTLRPAADPAPDAPAETKAL